MTALQELNVRRVDVGGRTRHGRDRRAGNPSSPGRGRGFGESVGG